MLDNLEQVVGASTDLASLVEACPNLQLLVTSRELLRVRGEVEYPRAAARRAGGRDAVLRAERARARRRRSPSSAAGWTTSRSPSSSRRLAPGAHPGQILERSPSASTPDGRPGRRARQQTLRATIEWRYDRLGDDEKQLFARLSVFAGGCTLEAAEEIARADVDGLQSLVDKSLVRRTGERFWMLETIRELARERLAASEDADAIGRRHAEWFLALAEEAEPFLKGAEQPVWLQRLEDEHDNLRAGLDWFFDHGDVDGAVRLAGPLWLFWYMHGHVTEARRWLRRALDAAPDEPSEARAKVLYGAGYLAYEQNENEEALALLEEGFAYAKEVGATAMAAIAAAVLCPIRAEASSSTSDRRAAVAVGEEAVALARAAGDDFVLAIALNNLGGVAMMLGESERAGAYFEESLEVRRRIGDLSRIALSLGNVAELALQEGETTKAAAMFAEAAEIATAIGDKRHILFALAGLGQVAYREERWEDGRHAGAGKPAPCARARHEADPRWRRSSASPGSPQPRETPRGLLRLAAAAAFHLSLLAPDEADIPRLPGDHRARESGLRPGNLGAGLGGGQGDEPRRGRRLRALLRLTAHESAAQTSNGSLSVVLTSVRMPSSETEKTVCPV